MATHKNFGLNGVASAVQYGKKGGSVEWDAANNRFKLTKNGTDLAEIQVAQNPADPNSAASKWYVDSVATGLDVKKSVRVLASSDITLSGTQTVDGVTLTVGDRVLVIGQLDATENGIYVVGSDAWGRADDADGNPSGEVTAGMFTFIEEGSHAQEGWVLATNDPIVIGTTELTFTQFTGAGQLSAGNGIELTGGQVAVALVTTDSGLKFTSGDLELDIAADKGLTTTGGLQVVVDTTKALSVGATGVAVVADAAKALTIDATNGLQVVADSTKGLTIDATNGLQVVVDGVTARINAAGSVAVGEGLVNQTLVSAGAGADAAWGYLGSLRNATGDVVVEATGGSATNKATLDVDATTGDLRISKSEVAGDIILDPGTGEVLLPSGYVSTSDNALMTRSEVTALTTALTDGAYQIKSDDAYTFVRTMSNDTTESGKVEIYARGNGTAANHIADFETVDGVDTYAKFTHATSGAKSEFRIEAKNSTTTGDVDIRLVPQGNGNVFIGDTGDGVIQADNDSNLTLKGGNSSAADAGSLVLEGGDGVNSFTSGNVIVRGGAGGTGGGVVKLQDSAEKDVLVIDGVASAVNYFKMLNSAAGGELKLLAEGTDSSVDIVLAPKGAGQILVPSGYVVTDANSVATKSYVDNAIATTTDELTIRTVVTADGTAQSFAIGNVPQVGTKKYYAARVIVKVTSAFSTDTDAAITAGAVTIAANSEIDLTSTGTYVIDGDFESDIAGAAVSLGGFATAPTAGGSAIVTVEYKAVS
jgi:RNase P/RNase MRP subunit p29